MSKKVFVSGCFDLLHSGHIAFFKAAAEYGDLYVAIGADRTVFELKGRPAINTEEERQFMIQSVGCVKSVVISTGSGMLDFEPELRQIQPDLFVVNEDGDVPGVRYKKVSEASGDLGIGGFSGRVVFRLLGGRP